MRKFYLFLLLILLIFTLGGILGFFIRPKIDKDFGKAPPSPKSSYTSFVLEVWDLIKENYWDVISDESLANLFLLSTDRLILQPQDLKQKNRQGVEKMIDNVLKDIKEEEKKEEFVTKVVDSVLVNLQPYGRSRLFTQREEKELSDNVQNVSKVDYYETLGVDKDASLNDIQKEYKSRVAELKEKLQESPDAAEKLAQVNKAYNILKDEGARKLYDLAGVEPTMEYKFINPDIFYIHLTKFSPTTVEELQRVSDKSDQNPQASVLILDLRGNVGGAFDGLSWFLGPFIGFDQYAYQLLHKGEKTDFKTKTGWLSGLVKFKKIIVLIDGNTQSTAEVFASVIKKYNVGVLVGVPTKGWGTVERVFELKSQISQDKKYSVFLVHSLTLREDGQPIEGKGVDPTINVNDPGWQKQLYSYFHYNELIEVVDNLVNAK